MAVLSVQQMAHTGTTVTYGSAAAGGDTVDISNGRTFLHVKNGGTSQTVTLATPGKVSGLDIADNAVTVASGEKFIGPLDPSLYGSVASIAYSAVTSVTIAAVTI